MRGLIFYQKKANFRFFCLLIVIFVLFSSCSFEYGVKEAAENTKPDIIMENVQYVRVREGDPVVRFTAESAERYENKQLMVVKNITFEQFNGNIDDVNIYGEAVEAQIELDSGNISLIDNVYITVSSEDIIIKTSDLKWQDKERKLIGPVTNTVDVTRSDGTSFTGVGFSADARSRSWVFESGVSGFFVEEEEEKVSQDEALKDEASD